MNCLFVCLFLNCIYIFAQSYSTANYTTFTVDVDEASPTLKVKAVFTNLMNPYPTEISQLENQYVRLNGNHYFSTPYETVTQKTVFKLASSNIESFSKLSPFSTRGSNIHFGPYKDIPALSVMKYFFLISTSFFFIRLFSFHTVVYTS